MFLITARPTLIPGWKVFQHCSCQLMWNGWKFCVWHKVWSAFAEAYFQSNEWPREVPWWGLGGKAIIMIGWWFIESTLPHQFMSTSISKWRKNCPRELMTWIHATSRVDCRKSPPWLPLFNVLESWLTCKNGWGRPRLPVPVGLPSW